jgi:hypothetical protein
MIHQYTLIMLYRPMKESVMGPAGEWSVQASSKTCLTSRKSQMDRQISLHGLGINGSRRKFNFHLSFVHSFVV